MGVIDVDRRGVPETTGRAYRRPVRFGVLGPLEVSDGDGPLPLGGPKQRIVLAHLVLGANKVVPAEHLIDAVWGEEPPEAAKGTLQAYISRLRSTVGSASIEGRPPGYLLHADPDEVDALLFERLLREARGHTAEPRVIAQTLGEALLLWRGPVLADLAGEASLLGEIARLEELRLQAIEDRIAADLDLGHHARVVAELDALTRANPLRERFWGELMLALYRVDRQAEALTAYQRAREILADELGVDPSADLQRLHERILRQDDDLRLRGEPLRGYRLLEPIGDGAFGVVYRAMQPQVGREVAIKAVHPELANHPDFVRRFEREAQIVARLEHPHIVPLYDYWREPDAAYLVMRFLRGGSVERLLREGPIVASRAAVILDHVAAALSAAHRQGVVHRDVKPGNILLDEEGNAYLTDFGVALDAGAPEKSSGTMMRGTPAYLSPEQIRLEPASPQSDIYALGIVLYEMLAGAHPFPETSLNALLDHHVRDALPSVREARQELPPAVEATIARATAKDAEVRFTDALEVAAAFRTALEDVVEIREPVGELRNPYKGLRAFIEADAADFFGREALVGRLVRRMEEDEEGSRFLAVVGPSGSGKSSVVRAGLVPALRRGALPGSERWYAIDLLPGAHPLRELESALLGIAVEPPPSLLDDLELDELGLVRAVERVLPDPEAELLIVVDQLEEVFTLVEDAGERAQVLAVIRAAVLTEGSRIRVVATLRADFFDAPLQVRGFGELLAARTEAITPMALEELERAIVAPADRTGFVVEPRLLAAMITDVADRPGTLPLLQYALTELAEDARGTLTLEDYRRIGGVSGALAQRAEQLFLAMNEDARDACRQLFLRLVTLGEGTEDTRRRVRRSELEPIADRKTMDAVIEAFGRHRLLSFDRDPDSREPTVEIAHEALLRAWSRLRRWIDGARDDIRTQRQLATAAAEWEAADRDPSFLLRGARLEHTASWAETTSFALTTGDDGYLRASVARREEEDAAEQARRSHEIALERRSVRRSRALVAVFAVAALVAGSLTVIATGQSERAEAQARVSSARELAAAAVANLHTDQQLSVLLAIEAVQRTRSVDGTVLREAEEALHHAVTASRIVRSFPGSSVFDWDLGGDLGGGIDWGPAGLFVSKGTFASEGPRPVGIVDLRDEESGEIVRSLPAHDGEVTGAAFSPDGSMLATTGVDGLLKVWDLSSGDVIRIVRGPDQAWAPMFSSDGSRVVAAFTAFDRPHSVVRVLDLNTDAVETFPSPPWVNDVAFSPEGRRLVVVGGDWRGDNVHLIDLETAEVHRIPDPESAGLLSVAWSPDGRYIAAGGWLDDVPVWDAAGELLYLLPHGAYWVDWSPDSTGLLTGGPDATARIWNVTDVGATQVQPLSALSGEITGLTFSPDGTHAMTRSENMVLDVWDVGPAGDAEIANIADAGEIVRFSSGGRVTTSGEDGSLNILDLVTGEQTHDEIGWFEPPSGNFTGYDFAPNGRAIAVQIGGGLTLRDVETGSELSHLGAWASDWSPDGEFLASGDPVVIVDNSGRRLARFRESGFGIQEEVGVSFGPGGLVALAGWDRDLVKIWDWTRDEVVAEIRTRTDRLGSMAFDRDGSRIAIGWEDTTIWDVETGRLLLTLPSSQYAPSDLAFSPDGSRLAESDPDGTVRVFDTTSGELLLVLRGHDAGGEVVFSPDGSMLATDGGGMVRIWALDIDDLLGIARQSVTRSLTDEECRQYLHLETCQA